MTKKPGKFKRLTERPFFGTMAKERKPWHDVHIFELVRAEISSWPLEIKKELGSVLTQLQKGQIVGTPNSKAIPSAGKGVSEIRIKDASGSYRVFYLVQTNKGVLVFHAFKKKTQKTPKKEIETALTGLVLATQKDSCCNQYAHFSKSVERST